MSLLVSCNTLRLISPIMEQFVQSYNYDPPFCILQEFDGKTRHVWAWIWKGKWQYRSAWRERHGEIGVLSWPFFRNKDHRRGWYVLNFWFLLLIFYCCWSLHCYGVTCKEYERSVFYMRCGEIMNFTHKFHLKQPKKRIIWSLQRIFSLGSFSVTNLNL